MRRKFGFQPVNVLVSRDMGDSEPTALILYPLQINVYLVVQLLADRPS